MTTVPEEAVKAADIIQVITDLRLAILQDDDEGLAEHAEPMIKAKELISKLSALPHLPQGEPSAARELALEEIIALCRDYGEDSQPDSEYRLACNDIIEAIQERHALSYPDHADAGKVEGGGWLPMTHPDLPLNGASVVMFDSFISGKDGFGQVIARFDKTHGWHVSASVVGGKYIQLTNPIKWRPLFSAPSQEVAGS